MDSICRRQFKLDSKIEICFGKGRKYCGKRRKCWLPAFSPFPTMFSKALFYRMVKTRDGVERCYVLLDKWDVFGNVVL